MPNPDLYANPYTEAESTTITTTTTKTTPTLRRCVNCGAHLEIPVGKRGRPTRFCGPNCKKQLHKQIARYRIDALELRRQSIADKDWELTQMAEGLEAEANVLANSRTTWDDLHG